MSVDVSAAAAGIPAVPGAAASVDPAWTPDGVVELRSATWHVGILPGAAASVAFARILLDGAWHDLLRPTPPTRHHVPDACASFPLVPWSNRVVDCRLTYRGRTWRLPRTSADGTAMHGSVLPFAFDVVAADGASVTLRLDSRDVVGMGFPWQFVTTVTYALDGAGLAVTTSVRNVDVEDFPAGFGHHPYFVRQLLRGGGDTLLELPATGGYALTDAVATGPAGPVPERADYRTARPLGRRLVDDCLVAEPGAPARIVYQGARADGSDVEVRVSRDDVYAHWVVYVPVGRTYFAVEPATNANGGFALHERGVPGSGVLVLEPGEERTGTFRIDVA